MRGLQGAVVGLIVGTTLLTGCSEKVEASNTLPSTRAAKTTEALPPVGPADFPVPDKARTKDAAGAEAFLYYWVDLLNRQRAIPAGQPLRDLGRDCQECLRIAGVYDKAAQAGRHFEGGTLTLDPIASTPLNGDEVSINFFARQEQLSLVDQSGSVVESLPADPHLGSGIHLSWSERDHAWHVTDFTIG